MNKALILLCTFLMIALSCNKPKNKNVNQVESISNETEAKSLKTEDKKKCSEQLADDFMLETKQKIKAKGILRYSGLGEYEKKYYGFHTKYLLQSLKYKFYLITEKDIEKFVGQCIEIEGELREGWKLDTKEFNGQYTFEASAVDLNAIKSVKNTCCLNTITLKKENPIEDKPFGEFTILNGTIAYNTRPAPDIAYDYKIILEEPIPNPHGEGAPTIEAIPFIPQNKNLRRINQLIKNKTKVKAKGYKQGGFAESIIFLCTKYEVLNED